MYKIQPKTSFTGKKSIYLPSCHSTNEYASEKIQKGELEEGLIVITDHQTKGKGQRGNKWESQAGKNLTFTLILKPSFLSVKDQFQLNMAVSLGIYETLKAIIQKDSLKIKWPNDIYIDNEKIGGILIESLISSGSLGTSMVGIGLNINQTEFLIDHATSLKNVVNQEFNLEDLLTSLAEKLEIEYLELKEGNTEKQKERFLEKLFRRDEWHQFRSQNEVFNGRIKGITASGSLLMETELGLIQFGNKEFEYIL
ncbi:MAG: biotin--[acetyl-CoA-carboxylase] ligase [Cytophagales bacterium]|nr:biotin--[acetyl-CoA-carboxylase] ligase [Cytophagales bacterium]